MNAPQITVAIPTMGRPAVLAQTLERLGAEQSTGAAFEVIVASDAADPDRAASEQAVQAAAARGLDARHVSAARPGASAARNTAWRLGRAPLVLFLGDDMLPTRGLVAAHIETHREHAQLGDAMLGHVRWSPQLRVTTFMRWLDRGVHFDWGTIPPSGVAGWWHFYTANASVKRELLERVDGFDEVEFPFHYEDIELAARMNAAEAMRVHYRPDAVVEHLHETTIQDWRSRLRGIAAAERRFVARYPEARPYFHQLFNAALQAPPARGRGRWLARLIGPRFPWLGPRVWWSVDAYYEQLLAPDFLAGWKEAEPPPQFAPGTPTPERSERTSSYDARAMKLDPTIFKAYDIRGIYGEQIDAEAAEAIGRAFARVLANLEGKRSGDLRVGLGHDMRLSAPELAARYRDGVVAEGAEVIDAGQVATEMLYFLVGSRDLDGGLMCTASHNPKAWTGAKLVRRGSIALSGDAGIDDVRAEIEAGLGEPPGGGSAQEVDIAADFQAAALAFIDPAAIRPIKVVVDGGNGMAGPMVGPLLERFDLDLIETYFKPDGNFPDHEPNPLLPENRRFIIEQVLSSGAHLGIAWDGDADRCFFIDDQGEFVPGDFLTALLADSILRKQPGEAILYDVRASRAVPDTVARAGGTAWVNRVGHAFFKTRMRDEGAIFGGEVSGHYYFRDFYNADSGTIPALLILELLSVEGKRMSELLEPYRSSYFISGEINSTVADAAAKIEEIAEHYGDARQSRLDGISIDYDDWHFNVRPSNTEPLLRLNLESLVSLEDMERRRDEVLELIRS